MQIEDGRDRSPYAVLDHAELTSAEVLALPPLALRTWLLLQCYVGKGGWCLGQAQLAEELGARTKSVQRAMARLKKDGLIRVVPQRTPAGDPGWNRYILQTPPSLRPQTLPLRVVADDEGGGSPPSGGVPSIEGGGSPPSGGEGPLQMEGLPQTNTQTNTSTPPPNPPPGDPVGGCSPQLIELCQLGLDLCHPTLRFRPGEVSRSDAVAVISAIKRSGRRWTETRRTREVAAAIELVLDDWTPPNLDDECVDVDFCPPADHHWTDAATAELTGRYWCTTCGLNLAEGETPASYLKDVG